MEPQDDSREQLERWNMEGRECFEQGDLEGALDRFSRALELSALGRGDSLGRAGVLNNMGMVQVRLGRFQDARASFRMAAVAYRETGDPVSAAWQMGNAGSACRDMQAFEEALKLYHEALAVFSGLGPAMGVADQSGNIGYIHAMQGDPHGALAWFEKALEIYLQEGEERKADMTRKNMETLRCAVGDRP